MRRLFRFRQHGRRRSRGQSLVEFAMIVPVMLAFLAGALDMARVFNTWITLQAATRDAAEFVATNSTDATSAAAAARRVGSPPSSTENCSNPTVTIVAFTRSTTAPGATAGTPGVTVTVRTQMPFSMLFPYPLVPLQGWTLSSTQTYSILQNR
jgi:Flp pilus assembly protein TadG